MTQVEFKAWFEGFTEALDGVPNKAQWKRIKERVKDIDGRSINERVFIDRYWGPRPYYPYYYYPYGVGPIYSGTAVYNASQATANAVVGSTFSPQQAMYTLGKTDAEQDL